MLNSFVRFTAQRLGSFVDRFRSKMGAEIPSQRFDAAPRIFKTERVTDHTRAQIRGSDLKKSAYFERCRHLGGDVDIVSLRLLLFLCTFFFHFGLVRFFLFVLVDGTDNPLEIFASTCLYGSIRRGMRTEPRVREMRRNLILGQE